MRKGLVLFVVLVTLLGLSLAPIAGAQDTPEVPSPTPTPTLDPVAVTYPDTFPIAVFIQGIVDGLDADTVIIKSHGMNVLFWLSDSVDSQLLIIGKPVGVIVVLASDVTMTVVEVTEPTGEVDAGDDLPPEEVKHPVVLALAEAFDAPYEEIYGWAFVNKFGFGDIARAYLVARRLGNVEVTDLLALIDDAGANWGDILFAYRVPVVWFIRGFVLKGTLVIVGLVLPDDVLPDGTLTSVDVTLWWWIDPTNTGEAGEEEEVKGGNHGCPRPGNYCHAPGWIRNFGGEDEGED